MKKIIKVKNKTLLFDSEKSELLFEIVINGFPIHTIKLYKTKNNNFFKIIIYYVNTHPPKLIYLNDSDLLNFCNYWNIYNVYEKYFNIEEA